MAFVFAFECSTVGMLDFVNVMNSSIVTHNRLFFVCCSYLNMLIAGKRKYNHKTLREKYQGLQDLEKGMSNKYVAANYGVPKKHFINLGQEQIKTFRFTRNRKQPQATKIEKR